MARSMQICAPGSTMEQRRSSTIIVHGTVRAALSEGASCARQITIVTPQGVVYDVESTFIGATLWRLEGYRVAARAQLVRVTGNHPVIRVSSLTIFGRDRADGHAPSAPSVTDAAAPPIETGPEPLDAGGADS
jgi:hypothetical protein